MASSNHTSHISATMIPLSVHISSSPLLIFGMPFYLTGVTLSLPQQQARHRHSPQMLFIRTSVFLISTTSICLGSMLSSKTPRAWTRHLPAKKEGATSGWDLTSDIIHALARAAHRCIARAHSNHAWVQAKALAMP